jgi:hypothetical protein
MDGALVTEPTLRILSLGAGVQSTALALMACDGTLPGLDCAIFADTGWEPKAVYEQVDRIEAELNRVGIPLYRVAKANLRDDTLDPEHRYGSIPWFVRNPDGTKGMGRRQCTKEYKLMPINRKVRELLGAAPPDFRYVPRDGRHAEQWIGFSYDEITRVNDKARNLYTTMRYPLIDLKMDRNACRAWLESRGWGHTVKSACIGCPYNGNRQWREMRDQRPDEWADAVDFDRRIRDGGGKGETMVGQAFLHSSCVPLELAPIDKVLSRDVREDQMTIFEELIIQEEGDPDGCSPYGCRSGLAVEDDDDALDDALDLDGAEA